MGIEMSLGVTAGAKIGAESAGKLKSNVNKNAQTASVWEKRFDEEKERYVLSGANDKGQVLIRYYVDGDVPVYKNEYQYHENGTRKQNTQTCFDDGKPCMYAIDEYDDKERLISTKADWGADGKMDSVTMYKHDENGRVSVGHIDYGLDGDIDIVEMYKYDENGRKSATHTDYDCDGKIDNIEEYKYDADGDMVAIFYDNDADGNPDEINVRLFDERTGGL